MTLLPGAHNVSMIMGVSHREHNSSAPTDEKARNGHRQERIEWSLPSIPGPNAHVGRSLGPYEGAQ